MSARWLARGAFGLALASAEVLIGFADLSDLTLVVVGAVVACLIAAGGYWFLAHLGVLRWQAFGLVIVVLTGQGLGHIAHGDPRYADKSEYPGTSSHKAGRKVTRNGAVQMTVDIERSQHGGGSTEKGSQISAERGLWSGIGL